VTRIGRNRNYDGLRRSKFSLRFLAEIALDLAPARGSSGRFARACALGFDRHVHIPPVGEGDRYPRHQTERPGVGMGQDGDRRNRTKSKGVANPSGPREASET
jgi:hypothetical protein